MIREAGARIFLAVLLGQTNRGVPDSLKVPQTQRLLFQAHGRGDQIYVCKEAEGKFGWVLKAPDAKLFGTDGKQLGRHFAGPTWEANDGSRVVGKAVANEPSPDAHSIPWLRVEAVGHEGAGMMAAVSTIQRLQTQGGKAAVGGCDASKAGLETRVPYEADYYFYGPAK
jgi:hypothetical protein